MVIDTGGVSGTVKIRENRTKRIPRRMELDGEHVNAQIE